VDSFPCFMIYFFLICFVNFVFVIFQVYNSTYAIKKLNFRGRGLRNFIDLLDLEKK